MTLMRVPLQTGLALMGSLLAVALLVRAATPVSSATAGPLSPAARDTVILTNTNWERVTVQVRIGNEQDPNANREYGTRVLERTQSWTIPSNAEGVHYRRDLRPESPDGQYTHWITRSCYGLGGTYEEEIP